MSKYKQYQNNPDYEFVPYTKEQHKYAMGGNVPNGMGNAQLELEENTLNPDGSTTQFNLPPHSQQSSNEGTQLDPGTLVFSDRLKMGKKTYAQLNKANNTSKEDAILASKANGVSKLTAELMKKAKNKNSLALFEAQEKHKYDKVSKYAKRVGLDPIEFAYGGVKKYAFGDQVPPDYTPSQLPNGVMGAGYQPNAYNDAMRAAGYVPMPKPSNSNSQPLDLSTNMLTQGMGPSINPTATPNTPQSQYAGIVPPNVNNGSYNFPINEGGGSGVDWGNVATQAGLGIAQNAGNIYDMYRTRKPDVENYERFNPTKLDPTQAIRDNTQVFNQASNAAREASVGNSSVYLNNRRSLAAKRMEANSRIRANYDNQNAGISNQAGLYNNDLAKQEVQNNLANKARNEDIRANAIGSMGKNAVGQYVDYNKQNTAEGYEKDLLGAIEAQYPGAQKNPALAAYYKKYGRTGK